MCYCKSEFFRIMLIEELALIANRWINVLRVCKQYTIKQKQNKRLLTKENFQGQNNAE